MAVEYMKHTGGMDRKKPEHLFAVLQILLDINPNMVFVKDVDLSYVAGTQSFAEMLGRTSMDEVLGRTDAELCSEALAKRYMTDDKRLLESGEDMLDFVEPLTDKNGKARYASTSKYILRDEKGETIGLLGISRDINDEIREQQRYQHEIEYLFTLPADTYTALYIDITDWRIIGQRRQRIGKYTTPQFGILENFVRFIPDIPLDKSGEAYGFYSNFTQKRLLELYHSGTVHYSVEYQFRASEDEIRWSYDEMKFMKDPNTGHECLMILSRDINDQKR